VIAVARRPQGVSDRRIVGGELLQVEAGRERVAGAGDHDDLHVVVDGERIEVLAHLVA
jgi:hypothetical protein